jgi:hypothetical protein
VFQVAVVGALNVGGAVIFPAFNHVLSAVFETPDAVAQELAATGDPVRAVVAGLNTAVGEGSAAVTVIADSVVTAINDIGAAAKLPSPADRTVPVQSSVKTTRPAQTEGESGTVVTTKKRATATAGTAHPVRALVSSLQQSGPSEVSAGDSKQSDNEQSDNEQSDSKQRDSKQSDSKQSDSKQSDSKQSDSKQSDNKQSDNKKASDRPHHAAKHR